MRLGHAPHDLKTESFGRQEAEMDALKLDVKDNTRVWISFLGVRTLQVTV